MIRRSGRGAFLRLFVLCATVAACAACSNGGIVYLATNLPQIVSYVERYNAGAHGHKISVVYVEHPAMFADESEHPPDIVAGAGLTSVETIREFGDLSSLLEQVGRERFYADLLALGRQEERQALLPLAFTLPMALLHVDDIAALESEMTLEIDELRRLASDFTDDEHIGFSPRFHPDAAYLLTRFFGVNFHQTDEGVVAWNESRLREVVAYMHEWSLDLNGGLAAERRFGRKYLHDPAYRLVADRRTRFCVSDIQTYLNLPAEISERLDFRWLAGDGVIPVNERVVTVGVPKSSSRSKAAESFLLWLLDPEIQAELLEMDRYRRVRGFGFAGGFSALRSVNGDASVRFYPFLLGRIPAEESLRFPQRLPSNWPRIRREVVDPWLLEQSTHPEPAVPLSEQLLAWQRQRPESR